MVRFQLNLCVILTLAASANQSPAASYQFVNIVDDTGPLDPSGSGRINNSGTVAFQATLDAGGEGIFIGSGGAVTTLYDSSGPFHEFYRLDFNDSGTVAVKASPDAGGIALFTGNGGPTTTISSSNTTSFYINNPGAVAFSVNASGSSTGGVFVSDGGPITTIADVSGPLKHQFMVSGINDSGTVGFEAPLDTGGDGLFTGSGGPLTTVALAEEGNPLLLRDFQGGVRINNAGMVAFVARLNEPAGAYSLFVGEPGSLTTVADTSGPFGGIEVSSIGFNNNAQVAFKVYLDGGYGIFTGPDPVADKVIQTDDPLFGSTVADLFFSDGLNDKGEIVFRYVLANGISGVAVARPVPEPATLVLCVLGTLAIRWPSTRRRLKDCRGLDVV